MRSALIAAGSLLALAAVIACVGVAGAASSFTVYSVESGTSPCFSVVAGKPSCTAADRGDVTVQTGDTVVWDFSAANGNFHNAASKASTPTEPAWDARKADVQQGGTASWRFTRAGTYEFYCAVHPSMVGTVTVQGDEIATPSPTATPTPTPVQTVAAQPTISPTPSAKPDDHTSTPSPGHANGGSDSVAPRLAFARVKKVAAGAQLRVSLSETATVTVTARRRLAKTTLTTATFQIPAGTRTITLRTRALKKGTYTIALRAVDARGNLSAVTTMKLRVK